MQTTTMSYSDLNTSSPENPAWLYAIHYNSKRPLTPKLPIKAPQKGSFMPIAESKKKEKTGLEHKP